MPPTFAAARNTASGRCAANQARVAAIRSGEAKRLGDDFPAEVRPLETALPSSH